MCIEVLVNRLVIKQNSENSQRVFQRIDDNFSTWKNATAPYLMTHQHVKKWPPPPPFKTDQQ